MYKFIALLKCPEHKPISLIFYAITEKTYEQQLKYLGPYVKTICIHMYIYKSVRSIEPYI